MSPKTTWMSSTWPTRRPIFSSLTSPQTMWRRTIEGKAWVCYSFSLFLHYSSPKSNQFHFSSTEISLKEEEAHDAAIDVANTGANILSRTSSQTTWTSWTWPWQRIPPLPNEYHVHHRGDSNLLIDYCAIKIISAASSWRCSRVTSIS